jgi:hypothetical protein
MTISEFKAWLDGFTDAMGDAPTPEQWTKIKAKMAQLREAPVVQQQINPRAWLGAVGQNAGAIG